MTIRVSRYNMDDLIALFPVLFGILIAMAILAWVAVHFVKRMDNNKPLITRRVKILEKIYSLGEIEWYVVEFENGERLKLRNLNAHKMILSAGDVGILRYKGMTIEAFQREGMRNKTEMGRCFLVLKPYFSVPLAILKEIKGESKMSKKVVRILTMLGVIFFLFMGKAYDYGAES